MHTGILFPVLSSFFIPFFPGYYPESVANANNLQI